MPKIEKEQPAKRPTPPAPRPAGKKTGSVWDEVRGVDEWTGGGLKVVLYGRNGSGKTTFGCKFPKPLLLLGCEDGTRSVRKMKGVQFAPVHSSQQIGEVADGVISRGYKSVVIDTATSLQDIVLRELLRLDKVPVQLGWGTVDQTVYRQRSEKTKELLRLFLDLAPKGMNVVVLAQEKNHSSADGEGSGDSEILVPFVGASLGRSTANWLHENVDYICQTYTREGLAEKTVTVGGKPTTIVEKTGRIEFCLRTQRAHPVYAAKVRTDEDETVPDFLVSPTYESFCRAVGIRNG